VRFAAVGARMLRVFLVKQNQRAGAAAAAAVWLVLDPRGRSRSSGADDQGTEARAGAGKYVAGHLQAEASKRTEHPDTGGPLESSGSVS